MATATGGDMVLQLLRELRDLQQQVQVENGRTEERLTRTEERLTQMQLHLKLLVQDVSELKDSFRITKALHEKYFDKLGRAVNMLAEQRLRDRERLDDHGRRIIVLEQS